MIKDVMTSRCHTASEQQLAAEILEIMQTLRINSMPVTDENNKLVGALNMHDLLSAGVI
jgi:arabinose-5-phosphate isomerase